MTAFRNDVPTNEGRLDELDVESFIADESSPEPEDAFDGLLFGEPPVEPVDEPTSEGLEATLEGELVSMEERMLHIEQSY